MNSSASSRAGFGVAWIVSSFATHSNRRSCPPFARHDPPPAMPALANPQYVVPHLTGIQDRHVRTAAARTRKSQSLLRFARRAECISHRPRPLKLRKSDPRFRPRSPRPVLPAPHLPSKRATAQPTTASSQWLSAPVHTQFPFIHRARPRPSVRTRYSAVRCSASSRCVSARRPNTDKHPGSPIGTANRAWTNDFQ